MDRLARKIVNQAQTAALNDNTIADYLRSVTYAFPKKRKLGKNPRRVLKPQLMEAKATTLLYDAAIDFVDQAAWDRMLDKYKQDYVPKHRAPEYVIDEATDDTEAYYAWEYERDVINDFVTAVRSGQEQGASENGVTDFVWIAVVDDRTDECCLWRDGLLVSEIEKQLKAHVHEDENCVLGSNGLVPPLHFNCRCSLAPATDEIPEKPDVDYKSFEDWLNT